MGVVGLLPSHRQLISNTVGKSQRLSLPRKSNRESNCQSMNNHKENSVMLDLHTSCLVSVGMSLQHITENLSVAQACVWGEGHQRNVRLFTSCVLAEQNSRKPKPGIPQILLTHRLEVSEATHCGSPSPALWITVEQWGHSLGQKQRR